MNVSGVSLLSVIHSGSETPDAVARHNSENPTRKTWAKAHFFTAHNDLVFHECPPSYTEDTTSTALAENASNPCTKTQFGKIGKPCDLNSGYTVKKLNIRMIILQRATTGWPQGTVPLPARVHIALLSSGA